MNTSELIENFKSKDQHLILDAVWWILSSTDKVVLNELLPHLKEIRREVRGVDLGGMIYRNSDNFELALSYIQSFCAGECRCNLYLRTSKFNPAMEAKRNHIAILKKESVTDLYEVQFEIECLLCKKHLDVREIHGGHVPWYEWKLSTSSNIPSTP